MLAQTPDSHHLHPHHIACPHCGHHTVVVQDENIYVCLRCGWRRNIASEALPLPLAIITTILLLVILL